MSVTLVDYGLGNIQAFANIYKRLNIEVRVAQKVDELAVAEKIILPGVGAFDWAMRRLEDSGMRACLDELVLQKRRPVLGVCVGMQMMAARSEEGALAGLGWLDAQVRRFPDRKSDRIVHLPHMGWNDVLPIQDALFSDLDAPRFYFLHSYYFDANRESCVIGTTDYHGKFSSAVRHENIYGVQFHPEKSHHWGVQLLKNFAGM